MAMFSEPYSSVCGKSEGWGGGGGGERWFLEYTKKQFIDIFFLPSMLKLGAWHQFETLSLWIVTSSVTFVKSLN